MMIDAGVPVVPGTQQGIDSVEDAVRIAKSIGLPIMFKASAGGGGKGIRLVYEENEIENAFLTSKSEAISSFGDGARFTLKNISNHLIISNFRYWATSLVTWYICANVNVLCRDVTKKCWKSLLLH